MTTTADTPLLRVENLKIGFAQRGGRKADAAQVREVVKGVSLTLERGRCLALVGESGSGKSVTARTFADGFNVMPPALPGDLSAFAEHVVPELRRRGLIRESYEGTTLRDHYGLQRPAHEFPAASREAVAA